MIGPFETFGHKLVVRQTNLLRSSSNWENILEQSGAMLLPLYLIFGWQTNISGYVLHHPRDLFSSGIHFYKNANMFETQISMKFIQKFTLKQLWRQKMFAKNAQFIKTLPKAQRTRALSSSCQSNINLDHISSSESRLSINKKPQPNISISTKLKIQNLDQT